MPQIFSTLIRFLDFRMLSFLSSSLNDDLAQFTEAWSLWNTPILLHIRWTYTSLRFLTAFFLFCPNFFSPFKSVYSKHRRNYLYRVPYPRYLSFSFSILMFRFAFWKQLFINNFLPNNILIIIRIFKFKILKTSFPVTLFSLHFLFLSVTERKFFSLLSFRSASSILCIYLHQWYVSFHILLPLRRVRHFHFKSF